MVTLQLICISFLLISFSYNYILCVFINIMYIYIDAFYLKWCWNMFEPRYNIIYVFVFYFFNNYGKTLYKWPLSIINNIYILFNYWLEILWSTISVPNWIQYYFWKFWNNENTNLIYMYISYVMCHYFRYIYIYISIVDIQKENNYDLGGC